MVVLTLTNLGVMAADTSTQTSVVIIFSDLIRAVYFTFEEVVMCKFSPTKIKDTDWTLRSEL